MEVNFKDKITQYEQEFFTYDKPVPVKGGLCIYPVTIRDYYKFYQVISCFTIDKNTAIEGIKMNDLQYMFHLIKKDSTMIMRNQFVNLLSLVFHVENGMCCNHSDCDFNEVVKYQDVAEKVREIDMALQEKYKGSPNSEVLIKKEREKAVYQLQICPKCGKVMDDTIELRDNLENPRQCKIAINGVELDNRDYKKIRQIYCYMNLPDYDDEYIDPELKEALQEAQSLKNEGSQQPTLERQIACVVNSTGYKIEEVYDLSLRKFTSILRVADAKLNYLAAKIGEMGGLVTFKTPPPHWIYTKEDARKSLFDNIMSVEQVESKIGDGGKSI